MFDVEVPKKLLDQIDQLGTNTNMGEWRTNAEMIKLGLIAANPAGKHGRKPEPAGYVLRRALVLMACEQHLTVGLPLTEQDPHLVKRCCNWLSKILHFANFSSSESQFAFRQVLKSRVKKADKCNAAFGDGATNKAKTIKRS